MTPALFLDRDDTVLVDTGYMSDIADFTWITGAPQALRFANQQKIQVFIVTNQGGIGRGFYTEAQMHLFHRKLIDETAQAGGAITGYCLLPTPSARPLYRR